MKIWRAVLADPILSTGAWRPLICKNVASLDLLVAVSGQVLVMSLAKFL